MAEATREQSWLTILTASLIGLESIPILVVWLPSLYFIVAIAPSLLPGQSVDRFDWAVLLYPLTWTAALVAAYRLTIAKRYRLSLGCTLFPLAHAAVVIVWFLVAMS